MAGENDWEQGAKALNVMPGEAPGQDPIGIALRWTHRELSEKRGCDSQVLIGPVPDAC